MAYDGPFPIPPAAGGSGTSTVFTPGSIIFAGASGVFSQDNAEFFHDVSNHQIGFGTNTPGANNFIQIQNFTTFPHMMQLGGIISAIDASTHQHAINLTNIFNPTTGSGQSSALFTDPDFRVPVAQTTTLAACFHASPVYSNAANVGTITTGYGFYYDGGTTSTGTLTTQYGGYFTQPLAGTTKVALYSDNAAIGTAGTAPPANGLLVNGSIQNTALTASNFVQTDASKNLISAAIPLSVANGGTNATTMATSTGIVKYDGTRLVTSTTALIDSSNRTTNSSQPAFLVNKSSDTTNATGNGVTFTVVCDTAVLNVGTSYNTSTGVFTAPIAGNYKFSASVILSALPTGVTNAFIHLNRNAGTVLWRIAETQVSNGVSTAGGVSGGMLLKLAANDTVALEVTVLGGAQTVTVNGVSTVQNLTFFSGYLVC